jgi:2,4-dienoyl-CoA reductase-like NADH-dependent reductase (Old Yellow Enzyme family)
MNKKYSKFFEPLTLKSGITLNNRIVMAPMTTNSSFENGMITTDEVNYYKRRASDVGAVITACAHVREDGKFASSPSVSDDNRIESLSKLAQAIQETGTKAILQIFHVGRMGSRSSLRGIQPISASAVPPLREGAETPREVSVEEVEELVEAYGEATRRAIEAGFDGVELHGANTYLIQQFFSPHSNRREDEWGGSLEKRARFPLAVIEAAESAIKKYADQPFALGYRISPEELENPGITLKDTLFLLNLLKKKNLDYIHVSLQRVFASSMRNKENEKPVMEILQEAVGNDIPLIGVGSIRTPDDAFDAMEKFTLPLIALGRELIVEPNWVEKVKAGKENTIRTVIQSKNRTDLDIPDAMWEYINARPGWLPIDR